MDRNQKLRRKKLLSLRLRPSVYSLIYNSELYELKLPIDPNFLLFADKEIEIEYNKRLYMNHLDNTPTEEFKADLLYFYTFITLMCVCYGTFSIIFFKEGSLSEPHLIFHLSFLSFILLFAYILLFFVKKTVKCLENMRFYFFLLGLIFYSYLIIGNDKILNRFFSDTSSDYTLPLNIGIISITISLRLILFDSFFYTICSVAYAILLYLICNVSFTVEPRSNVFSNFFIIVIGLIMQLIETQGLDYRSKQIFWAQNRKERSLKTSESILKKNDDGINTEPELLIKSVEKVQKTLKNACAVIIYRDIKDSLKMAQLELEGIKHRIGTAMFSSEIKIEDGLIDAEDKEFITQNFVDVGYKNSEKSSVRHPTLINFVEKIVHYPFSHYGLDKLDSILSQVGQS